MKCIDAIEANVKCIIARIYEVFIEERLDDTEYIQNVRAVIEGTDVFIQNNRGIVTDPGLLRKVLYEFSKDLWLRNLSISRAEDAVTNDKGCTSENAEYYEYYYDYIYHHGVYPR